MPSKRLRLATCIAVCLLCTGCWDRREIDELAVVSASGLDIVKQKSGPPSYVVSFQIARASELSTTSSGGSASSTGTTDAFLVEQAQGPDMITALENIRKKLSRSLFLGHRRIIVLGEDYAEQGIGPLLDEVVRNPDSRLRSNIFVAKGSPAVNILKLPYALNRLPADAIIGLENQGTVARVDTRQFIQMMNDKGDPYSVGIQPSLTSSKDEPNTFALRQIAVFQKDKLVGWLDNQDVDGFLWLSGQMKVNRLTVQIPGHPGNISTRLLRTTTDISPALINGHPQITVRLRIMSSIIANSTGLDFNDPRNIQLAKKAFETRIRSDAESTLNKIQHDYQADIWGFGEKLYEQYPHAWNTFSKNWRAEYSHLPVNLDIDLRIHRTGLKN